LRLATFFERTARLAIVFERTARLAIVFDSATGAAAAADLGEDFVVEAEFFSGLKLLVSDFFWIAMVILLGKSSTQLVVLFGWAVTLLNASGVPNAEAAKIRRFGRFLAFGRCIRAWRLSGRLNFHRIGLIFNPRLIFCR
jgi:hypothetical protein